MLFEIIIVLCVGLAAAGLVMLPVKLLRRKTAWGLGAFAAGIAMLGYVQWDRYTWADRYAASLPEGSAVVMRLPYDGWLEPWARVIRRDDRLVVLDRAQTMTNPAFPHVSVVTTLLVERNQDVLQASQFIDCIQRRRAPLVGQLTLTDAGLPPADAWIADGQPQSLFDAVCGAR